MLEQYAIPVEQGKIYAFSYWYKANANGTNVTLKGATAGTQYTYAWADAAEWTRVTADLTYATVDVFGDGIRYPLKRMGAVMTNDPAVGEDRSAFMLDNPAMDIQRVIDIPAVYLWSLDDGTASYAVRVINIPIQYADAAVYARPYYVFEKDGEEIVVYGSIYSRSYNDTNGSVPFYN